MTLKTILKRHGIKIRGLQAEIEKSEFEKVKWVHEGLNEQYKLVQELEKLNADLQAQHKTDLEQIQKLKDEIEAAKVKQKFTDDKSWELASKHNKLEVELRTERHLTAHLRHRIEELDLKVVSFIDDLPF